MRISTGWSSTIVAALVLSGLVTVATPANAAPAPKATGQLSGELVTGRTLAVDPTAAPVPSSSDRVYRGVFRFDSSTCSGGGTQRAGATADKVTVPADAFLTSEVGSYYALRWDVAGSPVVGECYGPVERGFSALTVGYSPAQPTQGTELTAQGSVSPDSDLSGTTKRTYAWFLDGQKVGTGPTFTPTAESGGRELVLTVTATRSGYADDTTSTTPKRIPQKVIGAPAPTIDDTTPAVGELLTAGDGFAAGAKPDGATVTYRWGVATDAGACTTAGAASPTHRVARGELGQRVCVVSTVEAPGFDTESHPSAPTAAVAKGTITATPTIDDTTPGVGQKLTASPGLDDDQVAVSYRWGRDDDGECNLFDDRSAGSTYTVRLSDRGTRLCVRGSYTSTGYESATRSSDATAAVGDGTFPQGAPTIDDTTPVVGQLLTAGDGFAAGARPDGTTVTYHWGVQGESSCTTSGDASPTHRVTRAERGQRICVVADASGSGYTSGSRSSAPTSAVANGTITVTPTIDDTTPVVGQKLTASPGLEDDQVTVSYRWGRVDDDECNLFDDRSAGSTYTVRAGDLDGRLCVRGTYSSTGYDTVSRVSAGTSAVAKGTLSPVAPTIDDTTPTFGDVLTAQQPRDGLPSEAVAALRWGVQTGSGATASCTTAGDPAARHTVTVDEVGSRLCVVSTVTADGYTTGTATSAPTAVVVEAGLDAPTPTVTNTSRTDGAPRIGDVLKATADTTGQPAGTTLDWAWGHVTGTPATCTPTGTSGSTAATYTVTAADGGFAVCVVATVRKAGHTDDSASSAGTATVLKKVGTLMAPAITGGSSVPRLGERLAIARPADAPQDATVSVAWGRVRSGACAPSGATGSSYTVGTADLGATLCATTTVGGSAYESSESVVSTRSGLVTEPARLVVSDRTIVGRQKVTVTGYGLRPGQTYRLYALGKVVAKGEVAANGRYVGTYAFPKGTKSHSARSIRLVVTDGAGRTTFSSTVTVSYRS